MIGIKGTGMTALAELLLASGTQVRGSDGPDRFFTDEILEKLGVPVAQRFDPANLVPRPDLVVYSAAYSPESNAELKAAVDQGLPVMVYPQALGTFSQGFPRAVGISGIHGKTTTTAMAGVAARACGLPASILVGSQVPDFDHRATLSLGHGLLIAETCEYRRHFLWYCPSLILVTSVELDHTDYFHDLNDVARAFDEYVARLPEHGTLVYCADDPGAGDLARRTMRVRPGIRCVGYGLQAAGDFKIIERRWEPGRALFRLDGVPQEFSLPLPGEHNILNAAGALAAVALSSEQMLTNQQWAAAAQALAGFQGTRRRSEIVGEAAGVLVLDDYGHHPTAVAATLRGLKAFYPGRRLVLDFMSHTYSRTRALLEEFAASFDAADEVVLHKIYSSAREADTLGVSGWVLFEKTAQRRSGVHYFEEPLDAVPHLVQTLQPGDLLVTMGAGDNWKVGRAYLEACGGNR